MNARGPNFETAAPFSDDDAAAFIQGRQVWLDPEQKVASFHPIRYGVRREFYSGKLYLAFLDSLIREGYLFQ